MTTLSMPPSAVSMKTPKTVVQKIFTQSQEFARKLLDEFGEPNSIVIIFNWEVGQNDFPPGVLITRSNSLSPDEFSNIMEQVMKMLQRLLHLNAEQIAKLAETLEHKAAELAKKETDYNERAKTPSTSISEAK